ncbi:MAG: hypothetical protein HY820_42335 [Acidobacteria bacterium]|nr:hypothetical protein [Acidobacteriota bacterium]
MRALPFILLAASASAAEWQLTFSPISKALDNNDNFSRDNRFIVQRRSASGVEPERSLPNSAYNLA